MFKLIYSARALPLIYGRKELRWSLAVGGKADTWVSTKTQIFIFKIQIAQVSAGDTKGCIFSVYITAQLEY